MGRGQSRAGEVSLQAARTDPPPPALMGVSLRGQRDPLAEEDAAPVMRGFAVTAPPPPPQAGPPVPQADQSAQMMWPQDAKERLHVQQNQDNPSLNLLTINFSLCVTSFL